MAKTPAERARAYRARKKALKNAAKQLMINTIQSHDEHIQGVDALEPLNTTEENCANSMELKRFCRTCDVSYSAKVFKLVSRPKKYCGKMILDLLKEVTKIDTEMDCTGLLPQFICATCFRKLHNAYDFIIQAHQANQEIFDFLNGIHTETLQMAPKDNSNESTVVKTEEESYGDLSTQNEFLTDDECNYDSLYPLVMNEALRTDEFEGLSNCKPTMKPSTNSKSLQFKSENLQNIPIKVNTAHSNELVIKEEPCDIDSGNEEINSEVSDPLATNKIVNYCEAQNLERNEQKKDATCDILSKNSNSDSPVHFVNGEQTTATTQLQNPHCAWFNKQKINEGKFPCSLCGQINPSAKDLQIHMERHSGKKRFKCGICEMSFNTSDEMMQHRTMHIRSTPYHCTACAINFDRADLLKEHLLIHSGLRPQKTTFCEKRYHHSKECQITQSDIGLSEQIRWHSSEQQFKCDICEMSFNRSDEMMQHRTMHIQRNYHSKECQTTYTECVQRRRRSDKKPFKCDMCEMSFTRNDKMVQHRRTHTGEKPYHCTVCGKDFARSDKLKEHMLIHSGLRPHKCTFCEKSYRHSKDLKIHLLKHIT